ncbi:MAG: DUF547 domain-containing protein [Bacteroidota bacterium]
MKNPKLHSYNMMVVVLSILLMACTSPEPKATAPSAAAPAVETAERTKAEPIVEEVDEETVEAPTSETPKAVTVVSKEAPEEKASTKPTPSKSITQKKAKAEKDARPVKATQPKKTQAKEVVKEAPVEKPIEKVAEPKLVEKVETPKQIESSPIEEKPTKPVIAKPDHTAFDALLRKYVTNSGKVNYKGIKSNQAALEAYLKDLSANPPADSWSRKEKMAYWINAYNAYTIKLIVDNYPLSSITKLHSGKPWDVKWIEIGGKKYSLNNIENDILRPKYKDARIHFAVNCAAKSCPPLLNRAWTAANLNSNFDKQAKAFINDGQFNAISSKKVEISKIFEWYAVDFGDIKSYLNKYSNTKIDAGASVSYRAYDWGLNE